MEEERLFAYHEGKWDSYTFKDLGLKPWNDIASDEELLRSNDFNLSPIMRVGCSYGSNMIIHNNKVSDKWLIFLTYLGVFCLVYIEDIVSIMKFVKDYKDLFVKESMFIACENGDYVNKNHIVKIENISRKKEGNFTRGLRAIFNIEDISCENLIVDADKEHLDNYKSDFLSLHEGYF